MLKKIILLLAIIVLLSINLSAIPSGDTITIKMCEYIDITEPDGPVKCQNEITEIGQLDQHAHFDIDIPDITDDDVIGIYIYSPNNTLAFSELYNPVYNEEIFIGTHLTHTFDVGDKEAGEWNLTIKAYDPNLDEIVDLASKIFTVIEEETRPCEEWNLGYVCCLEPKACPYGNRIAIGTCDEGVCCDAEANCQEPIAVTLEREIIDCEQAGLKNCQRVAGTLYNYSAHGPLEKDVIISLTVRDVEITCFDKTDIAIGYYNEANESWVQLPSHVEEISEGVYEVSSRLDYLGYIGVVKITDCVEVSCAQKGFEFVPTSGYVDYDDVLTFKICGLVPGCDATQDGDCDRRCPQGMDPDCDHETCSNTTDNCCLISKDGICDLDCDPRADPDCCDKTEEDMCCPGDYQQSGSQGCDNNCGLADEMCKALYDDGCTSEPEDCCLPKKDDVCDTDCVAIKPHGGNPDPDCGDRTSETGDSCKPACDGICDFDCVYGTDPDCVGYCPFCGSGICDSGETCVCPEGGCEEDCTLKCWQFPVTGTPCAVDCGICWYSCNCYDGY